MLLHLVAVSLVMMACASEALEANFDCSATESDIMKCLEKPEQKKAHKMYFYRWFNYNLPGLTALLKKLKQDGCIKAGWPDVQAWIKISTEPKAYRAIYKNLTKAQKTALVQAYYHQNNTQLVMKIVPVKKVIDENFANLSEADKKEYDDFVQKYKETC
uniref:Uncharacterized protein n=1 Tax=Plectus sambesii TaxID=2011161 RepID=A0A914X253_9BILA